MGLQYTHYIDIKVLARDVEATKENLLDLHSPSIHIASGRSKIWDARLGEHRKEERAFGTKSQMSYTNYKVIQAYTRTKHAIYQLQTTITRMTLAI